MSKVCQLFSGSSGNSILISNASANFLVDAGVSAKRIEAALLNLNTAGADIDAIFVTHEHGDHIAGVKVLAKRYGIPVFAQGDVLGAMLDKGHIADNVDAVEICDNMEHKGIEIVPFENSHDSVACVGYRFNFSDGSSIGVCTDTGYVTEQARNALMGCQMVYLESNHEITMLQNGYYPYITKQRILSDRGHLSNAACAEFATELVQNGTRRIMLAHLSRDNNLPDLARQTTACALEQAGFIENKHYRLGVSHVENQEGFIVL